MASSAGGEAAWLGDVIDWDGNAVSVLAAPDGTVVVQHVMGSFELGSEARDELRELLDRAAMPGQASG